MPIFEFRCQRCNHVFEDLVSLQEVEKKEVFCPNCNSEEVERLPSLFATGTKSGKGSEPCSPSC